MATNNSKFKFDFLDVVFYKKDDKELAVINVWCKYGFVVQIFTTKEKAVKINEFTIKNNNKDITDFVSVYWNRKTQCFSYDIEI